MNDQKTDNPPALGEPIDSSTPTFKKHLPSWRADSATKMNLSGSQREGLAFDYVVEDMGSQSPYFRRYVESKLVRTGDFVPELQLMASMFTNATIAYGMSVPSHRDLKEAEADASIKACGNLQIFRKSDGKWIVDIYSTTDEYAHEAAEFMIRAGLPEDAQFSVITTQYLLSASGDEGKYNGTIAEYLAE